LRLYALAPLVNAAVSPPGDRASRLPTGVFSPGGGMFSIAFVTLALIVGLIVVAR
jgi:hypothetical protein